MDESRESGLPENEKREKYTALIVYFKSHNSIIDWSELPAEFSDLMPDAIMDGIIGVYAETETYMLEIP